VDGKRAQAVSPTRLEIPWKPRYFGLPFPAIPVRVPVVSVAVAVVSVAGLSIASTPGAVDVAVFGAAADIAVTIPAAAAA
jgi:hypothetical protein